jgi:hypothetical protein
MIVLDDLTPGPAAGAIRTRAGAVRPDGVR